MTKSTTSAYRLLILVISLAILSYGVVGFYSRMMADDYCTANEGRQFGAVGTAVYNYANWSGLYTNAFLKGLFAPLQPEIHSIQTLILIVVLGAALWLLLGQVLPLLSLDTPAWFHPVVTLMLLLLCLYGAPNWRNVLWWSAIVPYGYPVALGLGGVALGLWLVRQPRARVTFMMGCIGLCVITAIIVGSANTFILFLLAAVGIVLAMSLWHLRSGTQRRAAMLLVAVGLTCAVAFVVVFTAPGNGVRQAQVLADTGFITPGLSELVVTSMSVMAGYLAQPPTLVYTLFVFVTVLAMVMLARGEDRAALAELPLSRTPGWDAALILALMALIIGMTVVTSVYGVGLVGPHTLFLPRVIQFIGAAGLAYIAVVSLARRGFPSRYLQTRPVYRLLRATVLVLLIVLPLGVLVYNLSLLSSAQQYAADWDARHAYLREQVAAGNTGVITVAPYRFSLATYMNLEEVDNQPGFVEGCAAGYYGVQEIRVVDAP